MSNSLSDQLLKAGLITQDQITQAEQAKQQQKEQAKTRQTTKPAHAKPGNTGKPQTRPGRPAASAPPDKPKEVKPAPAPKPAKPAKTKEASDLEQFYRERDNLERQERVAEEQRKREASERKKKTRQQVLELIRDNQQNIEDATVRYNFVVGETVKYLYVTEQQQQELADGQLAITFMDGKRCLISTAIAEQILALDPTKLVIFNKDEAPLVPSVPSAIE